MHYFMKLSILKNGSWSHKNRELREHWYYSATGKPHISQDSTTSQGTLIKHCTTWLQNQACVWKVIPPWPLCKGQRKSQITTIFKDIFEILDSPCHVPGLAWDVTHAWGNLEVAAGLYRKDCFTSMGYGALKSTSASVQSAFSALSVFQISS